MTAPDLHAQILAWCDARDAEHATDATSCPGPPDYVYIAVGAIRAMLDLHAHRYIYQPCGHHHTREDVTAGRALDVQGVGCVCRDGWRYDVCRTCCLGPGEGQGENCAAWHRHGPGWPACDTEGWLAEHLTPWRYPRRGVVPAGSAGAS